jgi:hypothetical protein
VSDVEDLAVGTLGHHVDVEEGGAKESKQDDEHRPSLITIGDAGDGRRRARSTHLLSTAGEGSHGTV